MSQRNNPDNPDKCAPFVLKNNPNDDGDAAGAAGGAGGPADPTGFIAHAYDLRVDLACNWEDCSAFAVENGRCRTHKYRRHKKSLCLVSSCDAPCATKIGFCRDHKLHKCANKHCDKILYPGYISSRDMDMIPDVIRMKLMDNCPDSPTICTDCCSTCH